MPGCWRGPRQPTLPREIYTQVIEAQRKQRGPFREGLRRFVMSYDEKRP